MDFITLQEATQFYPLIIFMILAAFVAVEGKDLLSSVIALGAVGLGLSVSFIMLKAPDVAITQFVVEIMVLVLLIRAVGNKALVHKVTSIRHYVKFLIVIVFFAVFICAAYFALEELPAFGNPYMRISQTYIDYGMQETGAANLVGSVLLDFRAYDTLGEATVLFTAVVGVVVVVRKVGRLGKHNR